MCKNNAFLTNFKLILRWRKITLSNKEAYWEPSQTSEMEFSVSAPEHVSVPQQYNYIYWPNHCESKSNEWPNLIVNVEIIIE